MGTEHEQLTQATYNLIAEQWAAEHNTPDYWQKEFGIFSRLLPSGKILYIGCGAGGGYHLLRNLYEYQGVDYSYGLLNIARSQFPKARFVLGNVYKLPFPDSAFDGFWAAASLLHIAKQNIHQALREIRRVVKPDGIGIIMLKKGIGEHVVIDDSRTGNTADKRFFAYWQEVPFTEILMRVGLDLVDFLERQVSKRTTWISFFVKVGQTPTIHALLHGSPLCGFSRDMPFFWPERHFFTQIEDIGNISCPCCNSIATLYEAYEQFFGYPAI